MTSLNQWASQVHAMLRARFAKHGYPEKVSLNVEQLAELFEAQDGRCYYSGMPLDATAVVCRVKKGPVNKYTIVIAHPEYAEDEVLR